MTHRSNRMTRAFTVCNRKVILLTSVGRGRGTCMLRTFPKRSTPRLEPGTSHSRSQVSTSRPRHHTIWECCQRITLSPIPSTSDLLVIPHFFYSSFFFKKFYYFSQVFYISCDIILMEQKKNWIWL